MKKAKLTLTLNKETVANLNNSELNDVKGGATPSNCMSFCAGDPCTPEPIMTRYKSCLGCGTLATCI